MHTVKSRTDQKVRYFFESWGYLKPEHLREGLFVGVPCELESTLTISAAVPIDEKEATGLRRIIEDSGSPELRVCLETGFEAVSRYLKACGVFEAPYRVHTVRILK
ncbi:MAG: hypothetical protein WCV90_00930 [Candidatus Woesearchaeota archaeon]|jgi:hypothetical protein